MRWSLGLVLVALGCVLCGASQPVPDETRSYNDRQIWILYGDTLTAARTCLNKHKFQNEALKSVFATTDDMAVFLELKFERSALSEIVIWQSLPKTRQATLLITLTNLNAGSASGQDFQALKEKLEMPK